jgi:F-type H+-transporting ATPase subunit b
MVTLSVRARRLLVGGALVVATLVAAGVGFASEAGEGAHHVDSAARLKDFGWRLLNFAVLAGILGWALSKAKVKSALAERQARVEASLREAQQAREAAERKLREYDDRFARASAEIEEMRAVLLRESEREKERIIEEARRAAEKIVGQATLSAEQEVTKARLALQAETGRLAVELAGARLAGAMTRGDHDRFVADYLEKVGQIR